ncbi:hypothetical protein HYT52_04050 [Candidatus Woesearchaeota archaeon]|nr:hypothetical protein [Candidatus Woesearchaeota archaeon]
MADEEMKRLPPEERIKKLKELEKKKKEEIEEAQKGIKDSESELRERRKWVEKVPIPEFAREDLENLSEDAQRILQQHRGISRERETFKEKDSEKKEKSEKSSRRSASALEETVDKEKVKLPQGALQTEYGTPGMAFAVSYKPMSQMDIMGISKEVKTIYQAVEERGYMTGLEQKRVSYALSEVERRIEAAEEGEYKGFNEQVAQAANLIQAIGKSIYHSGKSGSNSMYRN